MTAWCLLSVLLEQETVDVMTDIGVYTDAIFGIFYLLGFRLARGLRIRAVRAFGGLYKNNTFWRLSVSLDATGYWPRWTRAFRSGPLEI